MCGGGCAMCWCEVDFLHLCCDTVRSSCGRLLVHSSLPAFVPTGARDGGVLIGRWMYGWMGWIDFWIYGSVVGWCVCLRIVSIGLGWMDGVL